MKRYHRHRRRHGNPYYESDTPRPNHDGITGIYRARNGAIFGVCRGLARHFDISVGAVRLIVILATFFTGIWPAIFAYVVAALIMKPEPIVPFKEESDQEFYDSYVNSRTLALQRLKRTFDNLERRIQRMENIVTARDYDWDRRLNESP